MSNSKVLWIILITLVIISILSLFIGRYPAPGLTSIDRIIEDEMAQRLILNLRLPRILAAILLGMSLSAAGTVFQTVFANPIVEPGFLGVSQGAAFGAAFSIIFIGNAGWIVQILAAIFAFLGLILSYFLARKVRYGGWVLRLILAGISVSALFSAGLGILKYLADPLRQLQEITFWLLGGLWSVTWSDLSIVFIIVLISIYIMYRMRWRINLLSLKDETAFSLGIIPSRERTLLLIAATAATASIISISGIVGWVGLIMPNLSRRLFGADTRYVLPASMLLGATFTVICDDLARVLLPGEIPLGILTSLIGAVVFIILLSTQRIHAQP